MLKRALLQHYIILMGLVVLLTGCHKEQKNVTVQENNRGFTMPFGSANEDSLIYEDVEEFVLEEDATANPFEPACHSQTRLAHNQEQPLQDFTLEQLDAKDEMHVVFFPYDSKQPAPNQQKTLKTAVQTAREMYKQGKKVCCRGHACQWHGTDAYNIALSYQRADAMATYLAHEARIPKEDINIVAVGNTEPIAFEESLEGQAPNRRVEVYATAA